MKTTVTAILAMDENNGIGKDNTIPWKNKDDMQWVNQYTTGTVIVMGGNTWESLPKKPLPSRVNVVVSSRTFIGNQPDRQYNNKTPQEIISTLKSEFPNTNIVIFGGMQIYKQFHSLVEKYVITKIPGVYNCDKVFDLDLTNYAKHTVKFNSLIIEEYIK